MRRAWAAGRRAAAEASVEGLDSDPIIGVAIRATLQVVLADRARVTGQFRRVWLWKGWPDAWAPDAGIDLVAEEHDGGLWAIQAKAYEPGYAIEKADVDAFLAEAGPPGT